MATPLSKTTEEIAYLKRWAADNKCYFEDEGECGFGRPCVGIIRDHHYPAYRTHDHQNFEMTHECREAEPPREVPDAYHKDDVLCVLGRGPGAIHQLYLWVSQLERNGVVVEVRDRKPSNGIDAVLHGFSEAILAKRGPEPD